MKNKISLLLITLILLSSAFIIINTNKVLAYPGHKEKPLVCIPKSERTKAQLANDRRAINWWHRLSKLDIDCALLKIKEQEGTIDELEEKLGGVAFCINIPFNYKASANTKIYQKT